MTLGYTGSKARCTRTHFPTHPFLLTHAPTMADPVSFDAAKEGESPKDLHARLLAMDPDEYTLHALLQHHSQFEALVVNMTATILQQMNHLKTCVPRSIEEAQQFARSYFKLTGIKNKLELGMDAFHRDRAEAYTYLDKKITIEKLNACGKTMAKLCMDLSAEAAKDAVTRAIN